MPPAPSTVTRQSYRELTRSPRYSLAFALPLLAIYEVLALGLNQASGEGIRNGADVLLRTLAATVFGIRGPVVMGAVFGLVLLVLAVRDARGKPALRPALFVAMLVESAALALAFGFVVGIVTAQLIEALTLSVTQPASMSWPMVLMISLGAGIYEELVFRVLLVSALLWGARVVFGFGAVAATAFAVVTGALVFSAFHYIGPYGDPIDVASFTFRTVAGLAFSGLYVWRGFGITAWTHALYDVFLLAARGA